MPLKAIMSDHVHPDGSRVLYNDNIFEILKAPVVAIELLNEHYGDIKTCPVANSVSS